MRASAYGVQSSAMAGLPLLKEAESFGPSIMPNVRGRLLEETTGNAQF
jgi:hypothetical protein